MIELPDTAHRRGDPSRWLDNADNRRSFFIRPNRNAPRLKGGNQTGGIILGFSARACDRLRPFWIHRIEDQLSYGPTDHPG